MRTAHPSALSFSLMRTLFPLALYALYALSLGCDPALAQAPPPPPRPTPAERFPIPDSPTPPPTPPRGRASIETLAVRGFGDAVVLEPEGDGPFSVIVSVHGNYDKPEWQCTAWRALVAGRAFVLCPRGVARRDSPSRDDTRFTYGTSTALSREITSGLDALRSTYGQRVSSGPIVYAGFSLGAIYAMSVVRQTRLPVRAMVLTEGGHDAWTDSAVRDFQRQGGAAVLFACGQRGCANDARRAMTRLRAARLDTELSLTSGAGHSYGGRVWADMRPAFERGIAPALLR